MAAMVRQSAPSDPGRGTPEYVHDALHPPDSAAMGQAWQLHDADPGDLFQSDADIMGQPAYAGHG